MGAISGKATMTKDVSERFEQMATMWATGLWEKEGSLSFNSSILSICWDLRYRFE